MITKLKQEIRRIEKEIYVCESCQSEYESDSSIKRCKCCGKEVCDKCSEEVEITSLYTDNFYNETYMVYDERIPLCYDCYKKAKKNKKKYIAKVAKEEENFKKALNKLASNFINGKELK